jgi:hypothetical protein
MPPLGAYNTRVSLRGSVADLQHVNSDPAFYFDADLDPASRNGVDPCGSRSGSATLGGPVQPFLLQQPQIQSNNDIHLCLLVLISPRWIGGARSEATHSPQLLMHKEKADEG